jgi:hypothetical protein
MIGHVLSLNILLMISSFIVFNLFYFLSAGFYGVIFTTSFGDCLVVFRLVLVLMFVEGFSISRYSLD